MKAPRRTALGLTVLSLLAACSSTPEGELTDKQKLGYYLENAGRYYELGEIDRCLDQTQRGLAIDKNNEMFLLIKGRCHQIRGTREDIALAEQIFRKHPAQDDFRIQLGLAGALERKGVLYDLSAREIKDGERYTPAEDPEKRAAKLAKDAVGYWREAAEHYSLAEELYSGSFEALNGQLRIARLLHDDEQALAFAEELIDSIKESNRLFRAHITEQEAKGESIVETHRTLIDNQELEVWIRLEIAEILHAHEQRIEALEQLDLAAALSPNTKDLHSRRGQLLLEMGRYERARSALQRYLQLSNDPYDHPDIQHTYQLINHCDAELRDA